MEFFHKVSTYPFMRTRRMWYGVSTVAILASIALLVLRGLNLGIDFTGGVVLQFAFPQAANIEETRTSLEKAGHEAIVTSFGAPNEVMVRLLPQKNQDVNVVSREVTAVLQTSVPGVILRSSEVVGPQIGEELTNQGGMAIMMTFILVGLYTWFRFQWKMGLSAVVVFDRVRDNFHTMRRATSEAVLDASINQTLSRTVITSGATLLVVLVLLVMGGETLKGFSWALTIGILVGTYSSIYVAGAMALELKLSAIDLMPPKEEKEEIDALP